MRTRHCEMSCWPSKKDVSMTTFPSNTSTGSISSAASMTCCHVFVDPGITKPKRKVHRSKGRSCSSTRCSSRKSFILNSELKFTSRDTARQSNNLLGTLAKISRSYMSAQPFACSQRILPVAASRMFIQLMRKPLPTRRASGATPMPPLSDAVAILASRSFAPLVEATSHSLASMVSGGSRPGLAALTVSRSPLGRRLLLCALG
mmetsp:Transcript_5020/g.12568  ORF Transcript_5020/g.12568 Transcript_5020/m.12568 type:complete len:204 (-) Transcript_5020:117-728(-)